MVKQCNKGKKSIKIKRENSQIFTLSLLPVFLFLVVVVIHAYREISFQRTTYMTVKVNEKKTLLQYVLDNTSNDVPLLPSLKEYMETVLVYKSIKRPLPAIRPQESFDEFMKELVTRLVMEKSNNVIAYGYKTSAMESKYIYNVSFEWEFYFNSHYKP